MAEITVKIVHRDGPFARYFVYDRHGKEIAQVHRDVSKEIVAAKRLKKGLDVVLAIEEAKRLE